MSNLFPTLKHLLSRSLAWTLPYNGFLRKYLEGLSEEPQAIKDFSDNVYLDIFPQTTREKELWERQFNLTGTGTDQQRRDNIAARWLAQGGQGKDYLEDVIHAAGFTNVFIHEWWTEISPGVYEAKNPNLYLSTSSAGVQFGQNDAQFGGGAQFSGAYATTGGELLVNKGPNIVYTPPTDSQFYPEMIYVGAAVFPNFANVSLTQKEEFERLLLKYFPYSKWIGLLINYI